MWYFEEWTLCHTTFMLSQHLVVDFCQHKFRVVQVLQGEACAAGSVPAPAADRGGAQPADRHSLPRRRGGLHRRHRTGAGTRQVQLPTFWYLQYPRTVYTLVQTGSTSPIPYCTIFGSFCAASQTHIKALLLCCSGLFIEITSTWLPIPFANSTPEYRRVGPLSHTAMPNLK